MEGGTIVNYTSREDQNAVHGVGWGVIITGTEGVVRVDFGIPQEIRIRHRKVRTLFIKNYLGFFKMICIYVHSLDVGGYGHVATDLARFPRASGPLRHDGHMLVNHFEPR